MSIGSHARFRQTPSTYTFEVTGAESGNPVKAVCASASMPLVDLRHVHPVDEVVILDSDGSLLRFGQLPGVLLRGVVAVELTDLYLFAAW
jgi:hypothetical protein